MLPVSLPAGPADISLFGDGSYQPLLSLGTWAFAAPALGIEEVGIETGPGIEHFEVRAALAGIEKILVLDQTNRPIRVHTDSQFALSFLRHALEGRPLPSRPGFHRVRPLYEGALQFAAQRRMVVVQVSAKQPEHVDCHHRAARRMRQQLASDQALAWQLAFRKEEDRLQHLLKERNVFQQKLDGIEDEVLLLRVRVQALQQAAGPQFARRE